MYKQHQRTHSSQKKSVPRQKKKVSDIKIKPNRIPKSRKNYLNITSPKAIDYSKVMEKYGSIIDEEDSPKKYPHPKMHSRPKSVLAKENLTADKRDRENLDLRSTRNIIKEKSNRKSDLCNISNIDLRSTRNIIKEKTTHKPDLSDTNNYHTLTNFTQQIHTEANGTYSNPNDRVYLLLKLFRKYAKKFSKLIPLCEMTNSKEAFNELKQTIEQYDSTVHNEKLIKIFGLENVNENLIFNLSQFEPEPINFASQYESKITQLNNKIQSLSEKLMQTQTENLHLKNDLNNQNELNQNNTSKLKYQNDIIEKLKNKLEELENEVKAKQKTISYMENALKESTNANFNNEVGVENKISVDQIEGLSQKSSNNIFFEGGLKQSLDKNEKDDHDVVNFEEEGRYSGNLQSEIDVLDKEIYSLKSKLKLMINKD